MENQEGEIRRKLLLESEKAINDRVDKIEMNETIQPGLVAPVTSQVNATVMPILPDAVEEQKEEQG